jgi:hypothetical protein
MLIPYRIAFRSLNESNFLVIKSLFWIYDQRMPYSPFMVFSLWEVFLAACILAIPPIWFSGITSVRSEPRFKFALVTCVIDWIAYVILVPSSLFEYSLLEDASNPWLNLTFFVTLVLLVIVIIPTFMDLRTEKDQILGQKQMNILLLISLFLPVAVILPIGETFYSIRIESTFWLFFRQSIRTEYSRYYYFLSDCILSIQPAPTFPIGIIGWLFNFMFIYKIAQYGKGKCHLRTPILLGLGTLFPTLLNNVFMKFMGYEPSSIIHLPIPVIFFAGILIVKKLQPPLVVQKPEASEVLIEEIVVAVPLLHRLRSRLWCKEK